MLHTAVAAGLRDGDFPNGYRDDSNVVKRFRQRPIGTFEAIIGYYE
jgi:hypothetical protein